MMRVCMREPDAGCGGQGWDGLVAALQQSVEESKSAERAALEFVRSRSALRPSGLLMGDFDEEGGHDSVDACVTSVVEAGSALGGALPHIDALCSRLEDGTATATTVRRTTPARSLTCLTRGATQVTEPVRELHRMRKNVDAVRCAQSATAPCPPVTPPPPRRCATWTKCWTSACVCEARGRR